MSKIFFVTHPEVVINKDVPIDKWALSEKGKNRFKLLLKQPWLTSIDIVYCSLEQKALDGAEIVCSFLKIPVNSIDCIGEFDRSSTGYQPKDIFMGNVKRFFASPNISILGWETAQHAQDRIVKSCDGIIKANQGKNILIVAHGGVGSLYLAHLLKEPINIKWNQPETNGGNYFVVDTENCRVLQAWQPIDSIL